MITIPVKTNQENPAITTVFGKAKWIAFVDKVSSKVRIEANPHESGRVLAEIGVREVIPTRWGQIPTCASSAPASGSISPLKAA